jgi:hypothetical protein
MKTMTVLSIAIALLAGGCATGGDPAAAPGTMFDDFAYRSIAELEANGWIVRSAPGWPGVPGATWGPESVSLVDDSARTGNRVLRMTSSTDGTPENTRQTQFCHERKYLEGTYGARVRFTDAPVSGPDGDKIVETFYMIAPLKAPMDLDYSEADFEYLPNGGWGHEGPTMFATTWETFHPEPEWKADNESGTLSGSYEGWRTLVAQIANGKVRYYVDGQLLADHSERVYPEELMSINFNLWFIRDGLLPPGPMRTWIEDVDWVFHRAGAVLQTAEVEAAVAELRAGAVKFVDTVAAPVPRLQSPCDF